VSRRPGQPLHNRTRRGDELGLRRALSDRILPYLVAAMAFLAALALAGFVAAASLAQHWQQGAGANLTVQVPHPGDPATEGGTRRDRVLALLRSAPGIAEASPLSESELSELLRPWLGNATETMAIPLPAVIRVRLTLANGYASAGIDGLARRLEAAVPGTQMESHQVWLRRLSTLARSLQACAGFALLVVAGVAAAVVMVATRAGLSVRREAIEIVHGLGATGGYIAGRFAKRATGLAALGGLAGAIASLPVLVGLAVLAAPFAGAEIAEPTPLQLIGTLPAALLFSVAALPVAAGAIGFLTAQATVRGWLRRLP
jgi:cell division transport system permease protein